MGQKSTAVKWNYQILWIHPLTVSQKLDLILENKCLKNGSYQKILFTINLLLNKHEKNHKDSNDFWIRKFTFGRFKWMVPMLERLLVVFLQFVNIPWYFRHCWKYSALDNSPCSHDRRQKTNFPSCKTFSRKTPAGQRIFIPQKVEFVKEWVVKSPKILFIIAKIPPYVWFMSFRQSVEWQI